jgi:Secretion system C-terminal sorting domain
LKNIRKNLKTNRLKILIGIFAIAVILFSKEKSENEMKVYTGRKLFKSIYFYPVKKLKIVEILDVKFAYFDTVTIDSIGNYVETKNSRMQKLKNGCLLYENKKHKIKIILKPNHDSLVRTSSRMVFEYMANYAIIQFNSNQKIVFQITITIGILMLIISTIEIVSLLKVMYQSFCKNIMIIENYTKNNSMKTITLLFLAFCASTFAQSEIEYVYDNAGNRTQRKVLTFSARGMQSSTTENVVVEEKILDGNFTLFPNPTSSTLKIQADSIFMALENKKLYVYDMNGKLMLEKEFAIDQETIDLSGFSNGSYIVKIIGDGRKKEWRVVKK